MTFRALALTAAAALTITACNRPEEAKAPAPESPPPATKAPQYANLVDNLIREPELTTMVSALQTAGVMDTLRTSGPFTIFAPDNAAFERAPATTRDKWTTPEGARDLRSVLTYHIVPGRLTSADLIARVQANAGTTLLTSLQGEELNVSTRPDGALVVTDARGGHGVVSQADLAQADGVIHKLDNMLWPQAVEKPRP
jgi:uncharacterized surface protein with fasciclin (FAS1) repeats